PVPQGTALLSAVQQGADVAADLSAQYASLSGVDLSLADCALTLTLTQLPDVMRVRVSVRGEELIYRDRQTFRERDVLFSSKDDVVGTFPVTLFFLAQDGTLNGETRTLALYEGDTQVSAVVRALEGGPETKELLPVIPDGFKVQRVWLEDGECYVNLSASLLSELDRETAERTFSALEQSLLSLETVREVRFLLDGEPSAA
ncbi:MAG: GerMN domain-containing protein, partial [Oscillibacter sp.]|nr:GerMN domain-containing protein [Oscillibacter sp.]